MPSTLSFDRTSCSTFRFLGHTYDASTATVTLSYAFDDAVFFDEVIELPSGAPIPSGARAEALDAVLSLLHFVAGVSYYKAAVPPRIELGTRLSPMIAALLEDIYGQGLAEFAYTNDLSEIRPAFAKASPVVEAQEPPSLPQSGGTLVPIGGGKDSAVAIEIARAANDNVTLFSIGNRRPIDQTAKRAGLPHLVASRRISPTLLELNERGALNGHVPITAIVSLVALATAVLHGQDCVAMANERSASQANLRAGSSEVNHQWSKGHSFESALRATLSAEVVRGVDYFSILRPARELSIARAFARLPQYHDVFTSCNAVFRLSDPETSWCGECPKCRFVFLALAPFLSPDALSTIFGSDLLADADQTSGFLALCGYGAFKPFECVGEREESVAAFRLLAEDPAWRDHRVVRCARETLLAELPSNVGSPAEMLEPDGPHHIPVAFQASAYAYLGA